MFIKSEGNDNRWCVFRNEDTDEIEAHYEYLCPVDLMWITVAKLPFDDRLMDAIKYLI